MLCKDKTIVPDMQDLTHNLGLKMKSFPVIPSSLSSCFKLLVLSCMRKIQEVSWMRGGLFQEACHVYLHEQMIVFSSSVHYPLDKFFLAVASFHEAGVDS